MQPRVGIQKSVDQTVIAGIAEHGGAGQSLGIGRSILREQSALADQIGHRQVVALILIDDKEISH